MSRSLGVIQEELAHWLPDALSKASGYLEFGIGASTQIAWSSQVPVVVGVESSTEWLDRVRLECGPAPAGLNRLLIRANIGATKGWGYPVSPIGARTGFRYAVKPLQSIPSHLTSMVSLVLVDGRFRMLAAATSLAFFPGLNTLVIDDYVSRRYYERIATLLGDPEIIGRAALFHVRPHSIDPRELVAFAVEFGSDPR